MPELAPDAPLLVLITGTGRSGTSTMAGMLHHLGLHVPGPHLGANESNPKGFYESRWAMRFHKALLADAGLHDMDSRPDAFALAQAQVTPERREQVVGFLHKRSAGHPVTVVKDPRSVWTQALWREAAAEFGLRTAYVSMLRHPAEVIGSRATYYMPNADEARRRWYAVFNVSRWINNALVSERETRGHARVFVRYDDLLSDWRASAAGLADVLGLEYPVPPAAEHPVDEFIDPDLRRVRLTWDDLDIPAAQRDLAEEVWQALQILADRGGSDAGAETTLDALADRYATLFADAVAISHDALLQARAEGATKGRAEGLAEATKQDRPPATQAAPASAGVEGLRSRELLAIVTRRSPLGRLIRRRGER